MNEQAAKYIQTLQEIGPVKWAEGPNGWTGEDGNPITLTAWQRGALVAWWEHRQDVSTFAISNVKKTGKTFCTAVLTCYRWLAYPGQHFACGNDLDQAQARQFQEIAGMVKRNPFLAENVKAGKSELVFTLTDSKLTALAADAAGNAGANHLTASHTEAWGILYEAGVRAWEELTPPPGKFYGLPALRIADSYAGFTGESKTWHKLIDRGLNGNSLPGEWPVFKAGGLLLFHMEGQEAQEACFRGTESERIDYYAEQAESLRPNAFTRMHLNQRTSGESAFVTEEQWAACYSPDVHPLFTGETVRLTLGADASTTHDYTALVGMDGRDIRLVRVWKPIKVAGIRFGKPTVDLEATIGAEVLRLHEAGQVSCVVYDPWQMAAVARSWEKAGIKCVEMPQTAQRVEADTALFNAIISGQVRHYKSPDLDEAVRNAITIETPRGIRLAKEKASRKIDPLVALSMANSAALSGRYAGGTITYMPDPFGENSRWDDPDAEWQPNFGGWKDRGEVSYRPHGPGRNYTNCPYRHTGCNACRDELRAAGLMDD
jgi:phage terminase large subunit-like protein